MKEEKRELLLNASLKLFVELGFHGTTTSKIAKEAGVATGTLFNYFKSKEDLINSLYKQLKTNLAHSFKTQLSDYPTLRSRSHALWLGYVKWALACPQCFKFLQQYYSSPYISSRTKEESIAAYKFLHDLFMEGQQQGVLKAMDPELLMSYTTGVLNGVVIYFLEHPEQFANIGFVEKVFGMYWDSLKN